MVEEVGVNLGLLGALQAAHQALHELDSSVPPINLARRGDQRGEQVEAIHQRAVLVCMVIRDRPPLSPRLLDTPELGDLVLPVKRNCGQVESGAPGLRVLLRAVNNAMILMNWAVLAAGWGYNTGWLWELKTSTGYFGHREEIQEKGQKGKDDLRSVIQLSRDGSVVISVILT